MTHDARFSIIPGWIVTDPRLKGRDLQVLCLLGRHTDKHGWCRRSQVKMAAQLNCARSTVQLSLDRLSEIGVVEKHEEVSADGRDSAHSYRVIYDRAPPPGFDFGGDEDDDFEENDPKQARLNGHPPADISAPPADPESAPPADPGSAPINDPYLTAPDKREERERERDEGDGEENPKALERRFRKWWRTWPSYAVDDEAKTRRAWLALTPGQRNACEERTASYLEAVKSSGRSYSKAGSTYLIERSWERIEDIPPAKPPGSAPVARDGRIVVPVFGPAWAAARMLPLLDGPAAVDLPEDPWQLARQSYEALARASLSRAAAFVQRIGISVGASGELVFPADFEDADRRRRLLADGYPETRRLNEAARDARHVSVPAAVDKLKDLCEPVPLGSPTWDAWRDHHEQMGWPFVPMPAGMKVVYFPKGGPEGLDEFERAARSLLAARDYDDAA
ncbi:hypothetical protein [Pseudorhizobium flavum]|uniref:hypothetical protein n=1 Tax=Pseudorhizobium flavum TaxID=1335061 RepID=UPI00248FD9F8|nr:hypothetical protein [Pseudorhizobium flavum]